jgi:hypothetical protein
MTSILLLAIGITIATALMASAVIQFLTPITNSGLSPLEKNCQEIANEGYQIHALYPDSNPDELPNDDFERLMHLDELWITECVNVLSAESVFNIVNNVERDLSYGE